MDTILAQTIWQVMEELQNANQMETALSGALDILRKAVDCEEGYIWLMDDQSERLIAIMSSGQTDYTGMSVGADGSVIWRVTESGEPEIINDLQDSGEHLAGEDGPDDPPVNVLVVPLRTPIHTIGSLMLADKPGGFTGEDMKLCANCCAIVALDIEDKGFTFRPFEDREPVVSVRNVVKEYQNGEEISRVLKGVDLDVYPGELMVLLGESGCGKSTLINIIGGMDNMTSGELLVEGRDMSSPTEAELTEYRREYIGFIFQAYNLMPNLSAYENIEFIGEISENPMDSMEALRLVGLDDKADNMPSALSGGQMQRVSIARALVKDPKLILADEPTAALDYETSIKVLNVIETIVRERHTTVIMVTHNPEIAKMANRVIKLRNGKISSIRVNLHPMHADDLVW